MFVQSSVDSAACYVYPIVGRTLGPPGIYVLRCCLLLVMVERDVCWCGRAGDVLLLAPNGSFYLKVDLELFTF